MWQRMAREDFEQIQGPRLRLSGASRCVREQTYNAMQLEQSDPADGQGLNRMLLGHAAEILIIMVLEENGWETAHTVLSEDGQLELSITLPKSGQVVTGHPDGICRHEFFTKGLWVTLECKSMSVVRADEVLLNGVALTYPHYISQIALYGQELYNLELVEHPRRGVFGMIDRAVEQVVGGRPVGWRAGGGAWPGPGVSSNRRS